MRRGVGGFAHESTTLLQQQGGFRLVHLPHRAGTPPAILKGMEEALAGALADAEVRARIEEQGADVVASPPEGCRAFLGKEVEKWSGVIRDDNITLDG